MSTEQARTLDLMKEESSALHPRLVWLVIPRIASTLSVSRVGFTLRAPNPTARESAQAGKRPRPPTTLFQLRFRHRRCCPILWGVSPHNSVCYLRYSGSNEERRSNAETQARGIFHLPKEQETALSLPRTTPGSHPIWVNRRS